ncbi:MAG TPA: tRNA (adenosine(37)-N6)-threonylcarbamoyltransferase complex ATPase subunit type 1 TsaE [candidate division WOR-3 bacterium]|uniref:tRNA threonylcarbamoyladenosine biosynthesis protein TsaE n=1 Tax=candidate division WOR-3 bacterium TaxID=2052148 RepID=A0A7V0XEX5_UNCW3|nr:tRNA (adenosine(37)-N6)-threonylcarbamoyltransferase complex ATPase subunit type 1 TsaE [candidate division WOR-3 bacterium]
MAVYQTQSAAETIALGRALAEELCPGDVVAFHGDLGSGKTTMIKGIAAGLGVEETVLSPSFVIVTEYRGRLPVYHVDLYRLAGSAELGTDELEDYLEGEGVCLIEWAERVGNALPDRTIRVRIEYEGEGRRVWVERSGSAAEPVQ